MLSFTVAASIGGEAKDGQQLLEWEYCLELIFEDEVGVLNGGPVTEKPVD
jgi:hypothetical protein